MTADQSTPGEESTLDPRDAQLEQQDGRFYQIYKLGTGLAMGGLGQRLRSGEIAAFGAPSGPALFLHMAHVAHANVKAIDPATLFKRVPQGYMAEDHGPIFDYLEQQCCHVIFSFTALECFANESIPIGFKHVVVLKKGEAPITLDKGEIERRVNLDEKVGTILPAVFGVRTPKGRKVWERYVEIRRLRDRLIHLKSVDRKLAGPEHETVWGLLLKAHGRSFCDDAHDMMAHFEPAVRDRRWFRKYPYVRP